MPVVASHRLTLPKITTIIEAKRLKMLCMLYNGGSMNRLRTNALQNVQQHGCQPEIN